MRDVQELTGFELGVPEHVPVTRRPTPAELALIRSAGRVPRQRTTLYGEAPAERVARSFRAEPLAQPWAPHVNEARLTRPKRLVRPVAG